MMVVRANNNCLERGQSMTIITVGINLAKNVFFICGENGAARGTEK